MSNDWSLKCLDCDTDSRSPRGNHAGEALIELWNSRDTVIAAIRLGMELPPYNGHQFFESYAIDAEWWKAHKDHDVKPFSEYGYAWDECTEYRICGECGEQKRCRLKEGHTGEHQSEIARKEPG